MLNRNEIFDYDVGYALAWLYGTLKGKKKNR